MGQNPVTVEEVREAQQNLKSGITDHEDKKYNEAIEAFVASASIHEFEAGQMESFRKKVKEGKFKLQQESIAYMGCAAVHLNQMIKELDDNQKMEVPVDEQLSDVFQQWE